MNRFKKIFNDKFKIKSLISFFAQLFLFALIFGAASWWQQRNMLETNSQIVAPSISLPNLQGETYSLIFSDLENDKKQTLVYFFAPWCSVCHFSVDSLEAIKQSGNYPNLEIVMIALDWKTKEEVEAFLSKHKLSMTVLLGNHTTSQDYKITAFPSYYLVSSTGEVVAKDMGFTTQLGIKSRLLMSD